METIDKNTFYAVGNSPSDKLDMLFNAVNSIIQHLNVHMEETEENINSMGSSIDAIEGRVSDLDDKIDNIEANCIDRCDNLDGEISGIRDDIPDVDISELKYDIERIDEKCSEAESEIYDIKCLLKFTNDHDEDMISVLEGQIENILNMLQKKKSYNI